MYMTNKVDLATCLNYKELLLTRSVTQQLLKLPVTMKQALIGLYNEWRRDDRSCAWVAYLLSLHPLFPVVVMPWPL